MLFNKHRKLKNYFIYPNFQFKLVLLMLSLVAISPLSFFLFQYVAFSYMPAVGSMQNLPADHPYFEYLHEFHEVSNSILFSSTLVTFVFSTILGIIISHRVAGPIVKMQRQFNDVADQKMDDKEINFRKGDYFAELAEAYNRRFRK